LAIVKLPGSIGGADDPRVVGIFRKDKRDTFVEFGRRRAVGKRTFLGRVGGALSFADMDDAERAAGKACGTERGTSERRQRHTQQRNPQEECYHRLYRGKVRMSGNQAQ
jgi:hypothetical protein